MARFGSGLGFGNGWRQSGGACRLRDRHRAAGSTYSGQPAGRATSGRFRGLQPFNRW